MSVGATGRDRDAFALAIIAALVLTPLLEMHYLAALLVVVATLHVVSMVAGATVLLAVNYWRPQLPALRTRRRAAHLSLDRQGAG